VALLNFMGKKQKKTSSPAAPELLLLERVSRLLRSASFAQGLHPAQWEALRYIALANSFSNSPRALALYLGATKGTISQTVAALVAKGLILKVARHGDERSVALHLSDAGKALLAHDPLMPIQTTLAEMGDKTRKRFSKGLLEIAQTKLLKTQSVEFGMCLNCRFYREENGGFCMNFSTPLPPEKTNLLCAAFAGAN
jgi:DNA-binding MarR family transcriptional regulator